MDKTVKGILVGFNDATVMDVKAESDWTVGIDEMYRLVNCDTLDVVRLTDEIDMWVDDEGLMKSDNFLQTFVYEGRKLHQPYAGNVLILAHNDEGDTIGLTDAQVEHLTKHIQIAFYGRTR